MPRLQDAVEEKYLREWFHVKPIGELAAHFGTTKDTVWRVARKLGLKREPPPESDPTPEEIAEMTRAIRETWTDSEERHRVVDKRTHRVRWRLKEVSVGEIEAPSYSRI